MKTFLKVLMYKIARNQFRGIVSVFYEIVAMCERCHCQKCPDYGALLGPKLEV
jgi:hypothetical protein